MLNVSLMEHAKMIYSTNTPSDHPLTVAIIFKPFIFGHYIKDIVHLRHGIAVNGISMDLFPDKFLVRCGIVGRATSGARTTT